MLRIIDFYPARWVDIYTWPVYGKRDLGRYTTLVACPDWLKPILGKRGRRCASKIYDSVTILRAARINNVAVF